MSFRCASRQLFLSLEWALLAVSSILSPSKSWINSKINQQFPSERTDSNSAVYQWRGRRRCYTLGSMNEQPVVAAIYERVNHRLYCVVSFAGWTCLFVKHVNATLLPFHYTFPLSLQNVNGIKYHAKNGHRTQIRVRKPFKCRCGKSYKTSQGLRHHTINFHPPVSTEILRKIQG